MKKQILFSLIFLLSFITSKASHYMGGQITYKWVSINNYIIRLTVYRDCGGIPLGTTSAVIIKSANSQTNVTLYKTAVRDVTLLCPNQTSPCNVAGGSFGVEEHIYEATVNLPPLSGNNIYTIESTGMCCRNNAITTLVSPGSQQLFLSATLNPNLVNKNTSPDLLNIPIANFAPNQTATLSPNGFDADGDVLRYSLVSAKDLDNSDPVNYAPGFSALNPLSSSTPITINPNTGIISFTPSVSNQIAVIAIKVEEYRNGVKIGEIYRDIQIRIFNIANNYPVISQINSVIVPVGQSFCTNITATDVNNDSIDLSVVGLVPNSNFSVTTNAIGNAVGNFCFMPTAADAGRTFSFTANAVDNNCPIVLASSMTFNIIVPKPCNSLELTTTVTNASSCGNNDGAITLSALSNAQPFSYYWSSNNGFTANTQNTNNLLSGTYCAIVVDGNNCVENICATVINTSDTIKKDSTIISDCNKIKFRNIIYTSNTVIIDTFKNVNGCDSAFHYNLLNFIMPVSNLIIKVNCKGEKVMYNGMSYSVSTKFTDTIKSVKGCDSIYNEVRIIIKKVIPLVQITNLVSCNGKLTLNGITYNSSTTLADTIRTSEGCDSIYKQTNIIISSIKVQFQNVTINGCQSVLYKTNLYTTNTVLKDTIKSIFGCDSIIKQVNIYITPLVITAIDTVRVSGCGQVNHNGVIYNTNTILRDTTFVKDSCKASISVTIITANSGLSLTLNNISNICSKPQTLTVNGTNINNISKIDWYRDGVLVETSLRGRFFGEGRTVAGVTGVSGSATTHLDDPHGVFVIGNDMYITDWNNHRVLRWTIGATSGVVVAGGNGAGNAANQFSFPSNTFVKPNGDMFVTDYGNGRIQLWANGATTGVTAVSGLSYPRGMYVKANGDIIVANTQANEIRNGAISMYTNVGNNIANICEDAAGNMYVADQANNRILKYAPNATAATVAASLSLPSGSLNAPWGVYVDYLNQLYVTENGSHKLVRFPANSNATTRPNFSIGTGGAGTANNQFNVPNGVFVDNRGRVFVADGNNHRIQMFDSLIERSHTTNLSGSFTAVVTDINGCVTYLGALDVHIPPVVTNDTTVITTAACSYQYKGKKYTSSTIFIEDTIRTNFGCDSVINYVKIVLTGRSDTRDTIRLSSCGPLFYNGITYNNTTVIRDTISITDTCQMHIKVTEITINQQLRDTIRLSGCGSVSYNGRAYTNSIVIRDTISVIGNCITNLKVIEITVIPSPIPVITTIGSVCLNPKVIGVTPAITYDYITWKRYGTTIASGANSTNVTITVEATYSVEVKYSNGCVATTSQYIQLTPAPINVYIDTSACGAFMFNGIQISRDTIILKDTIRNSSGCVTQIRYNRLKVNPAFVVPILSINNVCEPTLVLSNVEKNATIRWFKDGVAVVNPPIYKQQGVTVLGNGALGAGAISLSDATGMVIDKHDNLFLADDRNNRILKYSLVSNTLLATITGVTRPSGIFVDNNDTLYSYNKPTQVVRFNSSYTTTTPVANIYNNICYGITKDQFNNLYANAWYDRYVNQYKPNNYAGANFMSGIFDPFALFARGISLHAVDHYYNRVYTKNILTGSSSYFTTAATAPSGCYVDDYQNMFIVTQTDGAVRYKQKNSNTQYLMVGNNGIGNAANQLNAPFAIAFDSKKNMYISDDYNHRVQRFDFVANYDTALRVTTNGVYTVRIENEYGCGITLGPINVSIPTATKDTTTIIACGTKVTYFGKTYTANTYINLDTVKSVAGCDSIIHIGYLKLTPNLTPSLSILVRGSDRVCKGSNLSIKVFPVNGGTNPQYQWTVNGVPVAGATGVYFISNTLNNGDTIRCILTSNYPCVTSNDIVSNYVIARIAAPTFRQVNISGCNSVTVNNITYQNSTTVFDTVRNNIGCDSIVTTTNITINKVNTETVTNNIIGCNSVVYNGVTYINSTTLKDTLRSTQGCDSLYRINNIVVTKVVAVTNITNLSGCGKVIFKERIYTNSTIINDTIRTAQGCDSVYNITNITVTTAVVPTIVITPSQNPVCIYTNIIYTSTITNGGTNPQYQWYKNSVLIPGATSATYSNAGLPDSTVVYTCTLTSNAPCAEPRTVFSNSVRLTFGGAAIATINITANQTTICSTATVIFTATAINGGSNPQYQWKKNGNNISGANSATFSTANIANNDVFTCVLTSSLPCVNTANVVSNGIAITVNASSVTDIYNDGSIIAPAYIPLYVPTNVSTTQPIGGTWKISNRILLSNNPTTTASITVSAIQPGANSLIYQLNSQLTKCTTNYIKSIVITSGSSTPTSTQITMCSLGLTRTLTSNYSSAGTWISSDPSVISIVSTSTTHSTSSVVIKSNTAGTANLSYNVQIGSGVFYTESTIVTVSPVNITPIFGNSSVCIGATTQLTNATPNGVWSSIAGRATTNTTGLVTGTSAGVAEIRYTVNNAATGCSAYAVKNVTVNAIPSVPTITYAPTTLNPQTGAGGGFCNNRTFDIVGTPVGGVWTSSNNSVMTVTNLGTVTTVGLGTATLTYTITNNGCSNVRSITGNVVGCAARGILINDKQQTTNDFSIYPNPAKSFINLSIETLVGAGSIIVTDLYGKQVKQQSLSIGTNTIEIAKLSKGIYFVSVISSEGKTTKKLIVN